MRKPLFLLMLCTSLASAAEDPETLDRGVRKQKLARSSTQRWPRSVDATRCKASRR